MFWGSTSSVKSARRYSTDFELKLSFLAALTFEWASPSRWISYSPAVTADAARNASVSWFHEACVCKRDLS